MKKYFTYAALAFAAVLASSALSGAETTASHRVSAVTVGMKNTTDTLVIRTVDADFVPGLNTIRINGIMGADVDTLTADASDPELKIVDLTWELVTVSEIKNDELRFIVKQERSVCDELNTLIDKTSSLKLRIEILDACRRIFDNAVSGQGASSFNAATDRQAWDDAYRFLLSKRDEAEAQTVKNAFRKSELVKQRNALLEKIRLSPAQSKQFFNVIVTAEYSGKTGAKKIFELMYRTEGAEWVPSYTLRLDKSGKHFAVDYYGAVTQSTGEEWKNVKISLSTERPEAFSSAPDIEKVFLSGVAVDTSARRVVEKDGGVMESAPLQLMDSDNLVQDTPAAQNVAGDSSDRAGDIANGIKASFAISGARTVRQDVPVRLPIASFTLDSATSVEARPELRKTAYYKTSFTNTSKFIMLPGEASIFRGGDFAGRTRIPLVTPDAAEELLTGHFSGLVIIPEKSYTVARETGTFTKTDELYTVKSFRMINTSDKAVSFTVKAQYPVSEVKEVKISVIRKDPPAEVKLASTAEGLSCDDSKGIASWAVTVPEKGEKTIDFVYCRASEK